MSEIVFSPKKLAALSEAAAVFRGHSSMRHTYNLQVATFVNTALDPRLAATIAKRLAQSHEDLIEEAEKILEQHAKAIKMATAVLELLINEGAALKKPKEPHTKESVMDDLATITDVLWPPELSDVPQLEDHDGEADRRPFNQRAPEWAVNAVGRYPNRVSSEPSA